MKYLELMEGAEPKLPGAPSGIKVMTPQQFVAKNEPEEKMDEDVGGNYLYHGTTLDKAKKILNSGVFFAKTLGQQYATQQQTKLPTVSFSRSISYISNPDQEDRGKNDYEVVFVADRNKLESRYKTLGTSQTPDITSHAGKKNLEIFKSYDVNKDGKLDSADADEIFKTGTIQSFGKPASREYVGQEVGRYLKYNSGAIFQTRPGSKSLNLLKRGEEFEEVVPVKATSQDQSGSYGQLPWKGFLVGFYLQPGTSASKDPELLNNPLRLDMPRPNTFVKANKEKQVAETSDPSGLWAASRLDNSFIITAKTAEGQTKKYRVRAQSKSVAIEKFKQHQAMAEILSIETEENKGAVTEDELADFLARGGKIQTFPYKKPRKSERMPGSRHIGGPGDKSWKSSRTGISSNPLATKPVVGAMKEATKLPAGSRPFGDEELTSYLDRIRNKEKKKTDKYKYPYIHRSSVVGYYSEAGQKYDTDAIKNGLKERPKALLKKNEKMKHSDGAEEQFFNIGFAALVGVAVDEQTDELIIVNTCPGAGSCKIDCFAMKGGKIQFQGPWLSDGRILTYLLNDPEGFFTQLKNEITKEMNKGKKGGYKVSIRWHDAGDFFSPEYMDMAFKLAEELPEVDFYAYTKVAKVALANKPKNFMINWSEGAAQSQERQVKAQDPDLETTKNSRIVPNNLFYDLLVKDEKKNLVKGPEGQWQVIPNKLPELKQRLADEYGISKNSILSYSEWEDKGKNNPLMKWNVIIAPGEPDLTAKDPGVLSTLLLKH